LLDSLLQENLLRPVDMSSNQDKSVMFDDEVKDMEVSSEGNSQQLLLDGNKVNGLEQQDIPSKPKFHMLKKLFMPWKWKKKKKIG